jgi:hypothetical protein
LHIIEKLSIPLYIQEKIKLEEKEDIVYMDDDFLFINIISKIIFIVCNSYILTIHDYPIPAFDKFGKEMELDIIVEDQSKIKNNKLLFAYLLKNLYLEKELKSITDNSNIKNLKGEVLKKNKKLKLFVFMSILFLVTTIIFIWL